MERRRRPQERRIFLLKERRDPEERVLGQPELLGESRTPKRYRRCLRASRGALALEGVPYLHRRLDTQERWGYRGPAG